MQCILRAPITVKQLVHVMQSTSIMSNNVLYCNCTPNSYCTPAYTHLNGQTNLNSMLRPHKLPDLLSLLLEKPSPLGNSFSQTNEFALSQKSAPTSTVPIANHSACFNTTPTSTAPTTVRLPPSSTPRIRIQLVKRLYNYYNFVLAYSVQPNQFLARLLP